MWSYIVPLLTFAAIIVLYCLKPTKNQNRPRKTLQVIPNPLAELPPEVRIQIFKHYFAAYRPEHYYREFRYKEACTLNLLIVLRGDPDSRLYYEALEQYHLSSHLLCGGRGNDTFNMAPAWAIQSIKDVTFGPRYVWFPPYSEA
jgi:hypothetical protein